MAILPTSAPPQGNITHPGPPASSIDIEAWTEQATAAMGTVTISTPGEVQGAAVMLQIPLDEHSAPRTVPAGGVKLAKEAGRETGAVHTVYRRKEPIRRDSLKRREAVLKGKEGSRRRQRWENGMRPLSPSLFSLVDSSPPIIPQLSR